MADPRGDQLMKTSDMQRVLQGKVAWQSFCARYEKEKYKLLSRKDGAITSGDLGLSFDSAGVVVTAEQIERLCRATLKAEIEINDAQFLSNVIALSGFAFENDNTEDAVLLISSPDSGDLSDIRDAMQILRGSRNLSRDDL